MTPTLIGYFPKRTMARPAGLNAPGVDEICSVSCCISDDPDGWIDQWRHNAMWVFDTPELAWSVVPGAGRWTFDLYAYRMFPVMFDQGRQHPLVIPPLQVAPLLPSFERLGYDAVARSTGNAFECSPLSCNDMHAVVAVNRYCLVDDPDAALRMAEKFDIEQCEPGPYYVVEVWREKRRFPTLRRWLSALF